MDNSSDLEDLASRLDKIEQTIRALQTAQEERRGPIGLPPPPSPRGVLRAADEVAIPLLILPLHTTISALKITQRALRLAYRADNTESSRTQLKYETLEQLDHVISEFNSVLTGGNPQNEHARDILRQARELRTEITEQLSSAQPTNAENGTDTDSLNTAVQVDVESELESIKNDLTNEPDDHSSHQ